MIELFDYQIAAIDKLKTGSILRGGVGSGKSRTALAYYYIKVLKGKIKINGVGRDTFPKKDIPLYVITTARKRDSGDWEWESIPFYEVRPVVDSWNNIKKYTSISGAFFIFDEQRAIGQGAWTKAFIEIAKKNDWILLSATPGDVWMDYAPVFIANGFYKNITDFRQQHVIYSRYTKYPKIERYVNTKRLEMYRKRVLVNMDSVRSTVSHHKYITVPYSEEDFNKVLKDRWNIFEKRPIKNAGEMCLALRRIVNADYRRLDALEDILYENDKAIIFYNFDYELWMIEERLKAMDIPYAQWNGHKHEAIPKESFWAYLVQYTAGSEAWNCIDTNCVIFYSQNYSYKIMEQAAGRIDRLNTPYVHLYYYHLVSDSKIDKSIKRALDNKRNFNERAFYDRL